MGWDRRQPELLYNTATAINQINNVKHQRYGVAGAHQVTDTVHRVQRAVDARGITPNHTDTTDRNETNMSYAADLDVYGTQTRHSRWQIRNGLYVVVVVVERDHSALQVASHPFFIDVIF